MNSIAWLDQSQKKKKRKKEKWTKINKQIASEFWHLSRWGLVLKHRDEKRQETTTNTINKITCANFVYFIWIEKNIYIKWRQQGMTNDERQNKKRERERRQIRTWKQLKTQTRIVQIERYFNSKNEPIPHLNINSIGLYFLFIYSKITD